MIKFKVFNDDRINLKDPANSQTSRLSELMRGFRPGCLTIIAGPTACGKSMLALNVAIAANMLGRNTVIASSEGNVQLRLNQRFKIGGWENVDNLQVIDIRSDLNDVSEIMKQQRSIKRPLVIIVDTLRSTNYGDETTSHVMQSIKGLSMSENASVIVTQQLNRNSSGAEHGVSTSAATFADMIIRVTSANGSKMSLVIDKDKSGNLKDVQLDYDPDNAKVW